MKVYCVRVSLGDKFNHFNIRNDILSALRRDFPNVTFELVRKARSSVLLENSVPQIKRFLKGM